MIAKKLEGGRCRHADGRGLLKSEVGGLEHEMVFWSARVLSKSAGTPTEHFVARFETRHAVANRLDRAGNVRPRHTTLWLPVSRTRNVRRTGHHQPVTYVNGSCVNADQHLPVPDHGLGDFLNGQDRLRFAISVLNYRFHRYTSGLKPLKISQNGITTSKKKPGIVRYRPMWMPKISAIVPAARIG